MAIDETFVTVILILAILAAIPAGVIVAVYAAKRLSPVTISPVIPWVLVALAVLLIGAALLFLLPVSYRSRRVFRTRSRYGRLSGDAAP